MRWMIHDCRPYCSIVLFHFSFFFNVFRPVFCFVVFVNFVVFVLF